MTTAVASKSPVTKAAKKINSAKSTTTKTDKSAAKTKRPKSTKGARSDIEIALASELARRAETLAQSYIGASVAFAPDGEDWMPITRYREVGSAFLVGVVSDYKLVNIANADSIAVPTPVYELKWTHTAFQSKNHVHQVPGNVVSRGVAQFVKMQKDMAPQELGESWSRLCNIIPKYSDIPTLEEEFEEMEEGSYREWSKFIGDKEINIGLSPGEVEAIQSMSFSPSSSLEQPAGLFAHSDGSTVTRLRDESRRLFGHSATSSFFAFIPLSFWKQVASFSNAYATDSGCPSPEPIQLSELMRFLGILWYMALVDKGEMRMYWKDDDEASIFPGVRSANLGSIMSWKRFLYIRRVLSFRAAVSTDQVKRDPAARIRPLINLLKSRCSQHVIVGRNVAVDESSIACRSRYARHLIVYNPRKPTGKYHFKLYMCCCSTSWLAVNFKLHCSSRMEDRLDGVVSAPEIARLAATTEKSSDIRTHVLEVTYGLQSSRRIVNTDNFYTSCLLLESLRSVGLFGRGTVRSASKHFPHFTMLQTSDRKERGSMKQGVCVDKHIVAASWVDGSIVNIVSNADPSTTSTVYRLINQSKAAFTAPTCVREYNSAMQGVDRLDQLRARFSLADGHSFQKWHKKLAMAMIDIARCNAYICDEMARGQQVLPDPIREERTIGHHGRDPHRAFVVRLIRELFDGSWEASLPVDGGMLYADNDTAQVMAGALPVASEGPSDQPNATPQCVAIEASFALSDKSRSKRKCRVCKLEGRYETQKTDFCKTHQVALCKRSYPADISMPHLCQHAHWTCWQKFHGFYLPNKVYNIDGHVRRSSPIYKAHVAALRAQTKRNESSGRNDASASLVVSL
jgi:hypothetical protein